MSALNIFSVASRHSEWLSVRRSTIASNVANVNTPGYRARDVHPFSTELQSAATARPASTHRQHIPVTVPTSLASDLQEASTVEVYHSGNTVNLDQEMLKVGELAREQALNAGVVRAFHRMVLASAKV